MRSALRCAMHLWIGSLLLFASLSFVSASVPGPSASVHLDLTGGPTASFNVRPTTAMFPQAVAASSECVAGLERSDCPVVTRSTLCFSNADLTALSLDPHLTASFLSRFDLTVQIETQSDSSSLILHEMIRILLTGLYGYSTRTVINNDYTNPLPRCLAGEGNLWPYICTLHSNRLSTQQRQARAAACRLTTSSLASVCVCVFVCLYALLGRSDWSVDQWQSLSAPHSPCYSAGLSGVQIQSAWFVDSKTRRYVEANRFLFPGLGAAGLDSYQAWTVPSVVALLEPFNYTVALADPEGWFVPPQCKFVNNTCGIAMHNNAAVELTVPLQQIRFPRMARRSPLDE